MNILSILFWVPSLAIKLALAVTGLAVVPFTHPYKNPVWGNREHPVPPGWFMPEDADWIRDYVWRAIRNPVNNLRYLFDEPKAEIIGGDANPDVVVRKMGYESSLRYMRAGIFSEFWYLRYSERFDRYFEFRIGWKFSGVPGFAPTIQLRFGRT